MKEFNRTGLRKTLEQLPVEELRTMLQAELEQDTPDPDSIRLILSVLEEQEPEEQQEPDPQREAAWETYQKRVENLRRKPAKPRGWMTILKVASLILIVGCIITSVPLNAKAETFWDMLQRVSGAVIEYFSGEGQMIERAYSFETENAGLQQVYDTVVKLGVTDPMVPMWLPEGYEITTCQIKETPMQNCVWATFSNGDSEIVYKLDVYDGEPAHQFYRDDRHYDSYERNGITFNITRNNERLASIWVKDNIKCSIILNCQEETLRRILKSIYVMEDE